MIYFDNAATTYPKPETVSTAVYRALTKPYSNPGRSGHLLSLNAGEAVYGAREEISKLFGSYAEQVVFTKNATEALNFAIKGSFLKGRKKEIIISDLEHNSVLRPVYKLKNQGGICKILSTDGTDSDILRRFKELCGDDTAVLAITHASNVTGRILPIRELTREAREKGIITVIDASQTAGILDLPYYTEFADFICAAGHKALYGPMGTGILIARGEAETLIEGGTGSLSSEEDMPDFTPERFEGGTLNFPGISGLCEGVKFVLELGVENVFKKKLSLVSECLKMLSCLNGVSLYTKDKSGFAGIISFNVDGLSSARTAELLNDMGICTRGGLHCAPLAHKKLGTLNIGAVRASFSVFNTENEVLEFCKAVEEITKTTCF